MSSIRFGRLLVAAIAIEALAILGLFAIVAAIGPAERSAAMKFAEETGTWFGPLAGVLLCFLGGYWIGKSLETRQVLNGVVLGVIVATIDVAILVAGRAPFKLLFVVSNLLRVVAGAFGGWVAFRARSGAA